MVLLSGFGWFSQVAIDEKVSYNEVTVYDNLGLFNKADQTLSLKLCANDIRPLFILSFMWEEGFTVM